MIFGRDEISLVFWINNILARWVLGGINIRVRRRVRVRGRGRVRGGVTVRVGVWLTMRFWIREKTKCTVEVSFY